jgi:EAL domain-containing protein (putative c-di-GMP-specific phosphodiesterase class I)
VGVEVTETAFVADGGHVVECLTKLAELGIGLALDDFGTGWSSLQSLKSLPLTMVKIDRSFVSNVAEAVHDRKIVQAVIGMAHGMSLQTIAEGIETHEQLDVLRTLGCDVAQGYLFGRPTTAEGIDLLLSEGGVPAALRLRDASAAPDGR